MCYIDPMHGFDGNWKCETCGRHMTPTGDCPSCNKKEKARAEAAGEIKRAKNIQVGDIISPRFSFHPKTIKVIRVEYTTKGKVVINKGLGYLMEAVYQADQWLDVVKYQL